MAKKILLIVAAALIVVGLGLFLTVLAVNHWDFSALGSANRKIVTHQVKEDFRLIQIDTDVADISVLPSEDGTCRVVSNTTAHEAYSVTVANDTLLIQKINWKEWYEFFSFGNQSELIVYLPKPAYTSLLISEKTGDVTIPRDLQFESVNIATSTGDVSYGASCSSAFITISTSTGDITVENISAWSLDLSVSTGAVTVKNVNCGGDVSIAVRTGKTALEGLKCNNLTSTGRTGRIKMTDVVAAARLFVKRSTGDVRFERCDGGSICVETDTGDVTGTLLSEKVFITQTDTGSVKTPKTWDGGKCEITTDTGDIDIEIAK